MPAPSFPDDYGLVFTVPPGPEEGNGAFFGRNVLDGLIDRIDDFVHERQARWCAGRIESGRRS